MKIRNVTAHAFGRFKDETLDLADGMNVIVGPNESGKSTWHAALYAALCGMRRGPGRTKEDLQFERQHRPWGSESWEVSCTLNLAEGASFELRQDLTRRQGSAVDAATGREVAGDLMYQNAPDGSRLLGLNRETFLRVASIRQADILGVINEASELQQHLERAAATSGAGETATEALAAIDKFQRENVGKRRANSTRPLQVAILARDRAADLVHQAEASHRDWMERRVNVNQLSEQAHQAEQRSRRLAAAYARLRADQLAERYEKAKELVDRYPVEPQGLVGGADRMARTATVLNQWEQRTDPVDLPGDTSAQLEARLLALPEMPEGDVEVADTVRRSYRQYSEIRAQQRIHQSSEPVVGENTSRGRTGVGALLTIGTILLLVGAWLLNQGQVVGGLLSLGGGLGGLVWGVLRRQRHVAEEVSSRAKRDTHQAWQIAGERIQGELEDSRRQLKADLGGRGVEVSDDLESAFNEYEEACRRRSLQASGAEARSGLEQTLAARLAAEADHQRQVERRSQLSERLASVVSELGVEVDNEGVVDQLALDQLHVAALTTWREQQVGILEASEAAVAEYARLEALLDGETIDQLRVRVEEAQTRAAGNMGDVDFGELGDDPEEAVKAAADEARRLAIEAKGAASDLKAREETIVSVAEAQETLQVAEAELARVESLEQVLHLTMETLSQSQERTNRNIAPVLAAKVSERLAKVTAGRYREVKVDPETLVVRVRDHDGGLREADTLSHGTAEQIYLLLRVAMAEILTSGSASCPLLFDDPTVHSDADRTEAMLDLLHEISADHQVILFSQEDEVARWAQRRMGERDRVIRLSPP